MIISRSSSSGELEFHTESPEEELLLDLFAKKKIGLEIRVVAKINDMSFAQLHKTEGRGPLRLVDKTKPKS